MSNAEVVIEGNVNSFSAKGAKKPGDSKVISGKLCIPDPQPGLLSELCDLKPEAMKAMTAAQDAGAKIEIPCVSEEMVLEMKPVLSKKKSVTSEHVTLKKIIYNATKEDPMAELHYTEPGLKEIAVFYFDNLGFDLEVAISKAQPDLDL